MLLYREDLIDRRQNDRDRTKGMFEPDMFEARIALGETALELPAHRVKHVRRCALKGEDRLLFVADGEEGAPRCARAEAHGKLACEVLEDLPLRLARILRLVDEDVVDALVELIKHPAGVR